MVKEVKEPTWKPLELEGSLLNNNDFEGLIGIEECTDYDISAIISNKKHGKKRTLADKNSKPNGTANKKQKIAATNSSATVLLVQKKKKKEERSGQIDDFSPSKHGTTDKNISAKSINMEELLINENDADMKTWGNFGIPESLLKAIKELAFENPTPIQALTLPPAILGRRDILGAAETGSGKTLAFGLPILTGILKLKQDAEKSELDNSKNESDEDCEDEEEWEENIEGTSCVKVINNIKLTKPNSVKPLYALILTPTRELAIQVKNHLVAAAKYTGIKIAVVLGGMAVVKQERVLSKGPEIVVATPGRLWELIQEGNPHLSQIDNIRFLAIDETDRMIEKGHFKELHDLLERLNADEVKQKQRQNFVFSATLTLVHELPKHLMLKKKMKARYSRKIGNMTPHQKLEQIIEMLGITNPKVVDVTQKTGTAETLSECRITCNIEEKDYYVYYFLQKHPGRTLIFCNSIGCVKRLTTLLGLLECSPLALHASMQQRQRLKNLDRFRDNENAILIATDVAARGLDIPCVEHVLHYQTPRTSESYVHRSGRTARASRQGITVMLIEPAELQNYLRVCRTLGRTQDLPLFPVQENMLEAVKERVKLARDLDKLELQVKKANAENGWLQKAAEEMDILIDEDVSTKYNTKQAKTFKKVAEVKRKQLAQLLSKPIFPKGYSTKYPLAFSSIGIPLEPIEQTTEKAVDVLKNSVENYSKICRKKAKWLFKPKVWNNDEKSNSKKLGNTKQNINMKSKNKGNQKGKKKSSFKKI